jgi:dihydrofolate reductase
MDNFAVAIDRVPKIVFSNTLKETGWNSAQLATLTPEETIKQLKQQPGKNIFIGSRSLIIQLMNLNLVDELQLCIHPVIARASLPLFENVNDRTVLKLIKTKTFNGGAVTLYYEPAN